MAYRTETLEDADFEYIVPRMFEAIGNDYEFINALYPSHQTQAGQSKIASRFIALKNAAPNGKWIKAVAVTSGEIVGLALWTVINQEKPPEAELDGPPGTWPNNEEKKYCQAMHRVLLADRRRVIRENSLPIMVLNIMAVFTQYQRQGVGKLLMTWGLHLADELQALCTVEATLAGQKLYQKGGFAVERDFYLDVGEQYADRPKDHLLFMVRPRRVQTSTELVTSCNATI